MARHQIHRPDLPLPGKMTPARVLNLGILAHVDAGKTSLTERLLYNAGVIDRPGRVDDGNTQTDTLALERRRGITIKSAVASFRLGDVAVNLIDTPGHPDFIAEVERALSILDGAILVVSAVEGVQAQTRILMRTLQRLGIPTLIFVNKIDRSGAGYDQVLTAIHAKLTPAAAAMGAVHGIGTRPAIYLPFDQHSDRFTSSLAELLAEHDDALLAAYLTGPAPGYRRLRRSLAAQTGRGLIYPVFFGSAITGAGVDHLAAGIAELLPGRAVGGDGKLSATVFKIDRTDAGQKIAYVRLFAGTLRVRDVLPTGRVTGLRVFSNGAAVRCSSLLAGQIGTVAGLETARVGDTLGAPRPSAGGPFGPPTLQTIVVPRCPADRLALHTALAQLADQDPLIGLRQDEHAHELALSLYGEVQREVIQATLAEEFGLDATFQPTTTICVERPAGVGSAFELIGTDGNPFLATVGLRVEPGTGVQFRLGVELGSMPSAFFTAVEQTVREVLHQGLHGWQVLDCTVTMTHCGYLARQSHAGAGFDKSMSSTARDFCQLTPLVLMAALRKAGTWVCEPVHRFRIETPADAVPAVLRLVAGLQAVAEPPSIAGMAATVGGEIPAARVHELRRRMPGLTRGEGLVESAFDHYQPVRGAVPARARTDHNPLNRKQYLLHVNHRV